MALPVKGGPEGSRGGAPTPGLAPLSTAFVWWAVCLLCRVLAQICQVGGLLSYFLCADQLYAFVYWRTLSCFARVFEYVSCKQVNSPKSGENV